MTDGRQGSAIEVQNSSPAHRLPQIVCSLADKMLQTRQEHSEFQFHSLFAFFLPLVLASPPTPSVARLPMICFKRGSRFPRSVRQQSGIASYVPLDDFFSSLRPTHRRPRADGELWSKWNLTSNVGHLDTILSQMKQLLGWLHGGIFGLQAARVIPVDVLPLLQTTAMDCADARW